MKSFLASSFIYTSMHMFIYIARQPATCFESLQGWQAFFPEAFSNICNVQCKVGCRGETKTNKTAAWFQMVYDCYVKMMPQIS